MDTISPNESATAESRSEHNRSLPVSGMEKPSIDQPSSSQGNTLRTYETELKTLQQENFRLRLRLFYIQEHKSSGNEEEFQRNVDENVHVFTAELEQRDRMLEEGRKKMEELEKHITKLTREKCAVDNELRKWKGRTTLSDSVHDEDSKIRTMFSDSIHDEDAQILSAMTIFDKQELEDKVKWLTQRLKKLEDEEVPTLRQKLDKRTSALRTLSAHTAKQEEAMKFLLSAKKILSFTQPKTEAFLKLLDDSLAAGDLHGTLQAKIDFQRELSKIFKEQSIFQRDSTEQRCSDALNDRVRKEEAELLTTENLNECFKTDVNVQKSRLETAQIRCAELQKELHRASEVHRKICAEKDKILDSLQKKVQEMESHVEEGQLLKSRISELESECNHLHKAVREKSGFVNELLSERSKAMTETEKSFQELLLSMKQKDELIEVMQAKIGRAEEGGAEGLGRQSPTDLETCDGQPKPPKPGTPSETEKKAAFQEESPMSPVSPEGPAESTVLHVPHSVPGEVKVLCQTLFDMARESGILPELSTFALTNFAGIQKVTEIMKSAQKKGVRFSLPSQSTMVNQESSAHCAQDQNELAGSEPSAFMKLGEKLQRLAYLFAVDEPVVSKRQIADVIQLLHTVLEKAKQEATNGSSLDRSPGELRKVLFDEDQPTECEAPPHLRKEQGHSEVADCDYMLDQLGSALQCVEEIHSEMNALPLTPPSVVPRKPSGSTDELIFAVDASGQLVPVTAEHAGHFAKDVSLQTEESRDDLESLKNELSNAKAQVKFLQKSLKDSFSVKITESPTGPNAQPLIEIDQNVPVLGSLGSPRKSGLSANRRWRKQLTNQKMSEFGLSENVFELQEEIFFLVLRIEDLERQLKETLEVPSKHEDESSLSEQPGQAIVQALENKNAALQEQLHEMQEVSTVLLCRLEELAAFLEQLLAYDETGSLGSVTLTAEMVAKIRHLVADSKDFSVSFSQSMLGSDTSSVLGDHLSKRASLDKSIQSILSHSKGNKEDTRVIDKPARGKDVCDIPPCTEDIIFMEDELKILRDRVKEQQSEITNLTRRLEEECSERASSAAGGRSKQAEGTVRTQAQRLEKLLRRIQQINPRVENTLAVHKALCQKLLGTPSGDGSKDSTAPQLPDDLAESLMQSMRRLKYRLEEMFISNEVMKEILTNHLASGKAVSTQPGTPGVAGADSKESEQLNQCKKELECKERREDILKRAMVREQNAKLQLEKELADCQKELQSLQEAYCALEKEHNAAGQRNSDLVLKEPQRHSSCEKPTRQERARPEQMREENRTLATELQQQVQEVSRLLKEETLLKNQISTLSEEKSVLSQKLEALQHEHKVLLESSSNKISELVTKLGALSTLNKNQQEQITAFKDMCDRLSRERMSMQCDFDSALSELKGLQVENQDLRETLLDLRKQESLLRENLGKAQHEQQAAKKISDEYCQSIKLLKMEKDQLAVKISDLSSRVDVLESEKQSLYEEKQRLILEVSAGEDEVERVNNKLHSCEEECNNLRTQKSEVEAELQACNNKLQEFENLAQQLREELSTTRVKLESMDTRCNHLEQELCASKEAHKQLLWKKDELQRALEAVGKEAQQSKSLARMQLDKKHATRAYAELQHQNTILQNAVKDLKLELEKAMHENKCLRLEQRVNEQFQSGSSSGAVGGTPDSSVRYVTAVGSGSSLWRTSHQPSMDSSMRQPATTPVIGHHSSSHSRSYHTSPDLGIDSDPTLDHGAFATAAESATNHMEHWQHRMGPDWSISSVHSAPDAIGGSCLLCQQGKDTPVSWKLKANVTYGGEQMDQPGTQSPSKSGFPVLSCSLSSPGVHLCAIVQLSDHDVLKKRVDESICLIRRVEASVQQALDALADFASDCTEPPECKKFLKDAERNCQNIKTCLTETFRLICSLTMAQVPEAKEEHSCENKQLRMELSKLQEKNFQQSVELQNARDEISSLKKKKQGVETAVKRQLGKTNVVLKKTKGNLKALHAKGAKTDKK